MVHKFKYIFKSKFCSALLAINICTSCALIEGQKAPSSALPAPEKEIKVPSFKGLVWMPFSWTPSLDANAAAGSKLESMHLRSIQLVVRGTASKNEFVFPLFTGEAQGVSQVLLEGKITAKSFYAPLFFELPDGEYSIEAVRASLIDPNTQKPQTLVVQIPNPFSGQSNKINLPMNMIVRNGKVSAIARLAVVTTFGLKGTALTSSTEIESLDRDVVPADLVLNQMHVSQKNSQLVFAANPEFPRLRISLTDAEGKSTPPEEPMARVGLLIDLPCKASGTLKLVWKRTSGDREFVGLVNLGQSAAADCKNNKTLSPQFLMPAGDWLLKATHILATAESKRDVRLQPFKTPDSFSKEYFSLDKWPATYTAIGMEREVQKQFVVRLETMMKPENSAGLAREARYNGVQDPADLTSKTLYMGWFELQPSEAKSGQPEGWETLFKRSFSLTDTRKKFGASQIFNAYTLSRLNRDRIKGTVQSVLRVTSSESDAPKIEPFTAEFRKQATENLRVCVTEREDFDPLVSVAGDMNFTVLKGTNSVTIKHLAFSQLGSSEKWVEECFQKKLLVFRFSKKVAGNFQGELKFSSE